LNADLPVHNEATATALDPSNVAVMVTADWDQFF
jgi:hypothetical protein